MGLTWRCAICLVFQSLTLKVLMNHISYAHGSSSNFYVSCGIESCPATFHSYKPLYKHVRRRHAHFYDGDTVLTEQSVGVPVTGGSNENLPLENDPLSNDFSLELQEDTCMPVERIRDQNVDLRNEFCDAEEQRQTASSEFVLQMKHRHHVTGEGLSSLMQGCQGIVEQTASVLKTKILHELKEVGIQNDAYENVSNIVTNLSLDMIFADVETNYLQDKKMKTLNRVNPKEIVLGSTLKQKRFGFKQRLSLDADTFYYMPILESLQQYLQNGKIFHLSFSHTTDEQHQYITDICDGSWSHKHPIFESSKSLKILLYYDDIEICCPLGSKSRKLSCFYYSLANLPKVYRSKLCNIRLVAVALKPILDKYGIDTILAPFVADINKLASGYPFQILDETIEIKGGLYCVLGDTPASHLIAGFKEGVGGARSKCRMCICTEDQMHSKFSEDEFKMRGMEDYLSNCEDIESADTEYMRNYLSINYGINRRSKLADVKHFDITTCLPQDIMHVVFEGTAQYEIKEVLLHYTNEGVFSVQDLNAVIDNFQYGYQDMSNKLSPITTNTLNSGDRKLKQNSAQTMLFVKIILLVLVNLGVDTSDPQFQFMVSMVEMVRLLMSPVFTLGSLSLLKELIMDHLIMFKNCFENCRIIPKQHYLLHFPRCIKYHGPTSGYSCMRFEGKNKIPKSIARRKNNFINVPFTVSTELSNIEAMDSLIGDDMHPSFAKNLIPGPSHKIHGEERISFCEKVQSSFGKDMKNSNVYRCNHVTYMGIKYISGKAILAKGVDVAGIFPEFGELVKIYIVNLQEIYLEVRDFVTDYFDRSLQSYRVKDSELQKVPVLCKIDDLLDPHVLSIVSVKEVMFIPTYFDYTCIIARKLKID